MQTTTCSFSKIQYESLSIFQCELVLENQNKIIIPMRESDGWINATLLCKAGGKRFNNWKNLNETKELVEILAKKAVAQNWENYRFRRK